MRSLSILAAAAALTLAGPAQAATLQVTAPWSRPAAAGGNGAGFMTIANRGKAADTLKAVETNAARKVEIHRSAMQNGVARMQRQDAGVAIPAGQSVAFAPGGYHVMFLGLAKPLKVGDKVPATLVFQSGARLKVEFQVGAAAPAAADAHRHH